MQRVYGKSPKRFSSLVHDRDHRRIARVGYKIGRLPDELPHAPREGEFMINTRIMAAARTAFFLCLSCSPLLAQVTSGTIFGSVKDPSGAVVPNASITVRAPDIGVTRTTTSSASGDFVVPNLPPAIYTITVDMQGFKKLEAKSVVLSAADKLNA